MDLSRSQIVIRQLQQIIKDRDIVISQINNECGLNECGPADQNTP